jgi:hypothetical protein
MIKSQRPRLIRHVDRLLAQILRHFSKQVFDDFNTRQMYDLLNSVGFFVKIMYQQIQSEVSIGASRRGSMINGIQANNQPQRVKLELETDLETLLFVQNGLCAKYTAKFVAQQQSNIKQMLENEDFQRLPLPPNYSIHKEMLDSIHMYPDQDEMRKNIGVFAPQESGGGGG